VEKDFNNKDVFNTKMPEGGSTAGGTTAGGETAGGGLADEAEKQRQLLNQNR
jgi:hypothetical protein